MPDLASRCLGRRAGPRGRRAECRAAEHKPQDFAQRDTKREATNCRDTKTSSAARGPPEGRGRGGEHAARDAGHAAPPCTWNHGTLPTSVSPGSLTEESPGWRTIGHCVPSAPEGLTRECHADAPDTAGAGRGTVTCPGAWRLAARPLVPGHSLPDHPSWNTNHHPRREGTSRPAKPNKSLYCAIFFYQKVIKI